ncbi:Leucine rich repeat protein [Operophtera brumata]|uniref:Leucine rich repeat protein n=1 Tax=Operophtera brumata TaxID=104452 RepID=A0A0L7KY65_OPEBR|nr:Leucine rich repeat protein [Operophtera brumata]
MKNSFPKLYELHTVDVSHNELEEIFNAVFQNLFSLRYLHLSHNSLTAIKSSTFGTLPTLLAVDVSYNKLTTVSRGSLAKLQSCREIDLRYNFIESIFQIPAALASLNLAHNSLTEIKPSSWPMMNSLLRLNLSSNLLADNLYDSSFSSLLTLQSLDLSGNGLSRPPWQALSVLSSLQYLYMQNNNLTLLSKSSFGNLPTLFHLDLSYNSIAEVSKQSFTGLQQLLDLSLQGNGLETIPNEAFKGLVALSPWIPYRLQEVDLSHNSIPVLTYDITYGSKTLRKLNLKNITELHLQNNILTDIPTDGITNATQLRLLDVRNNEMTRFEPAIVKKIINTGLEVFFEVCNEPGSLANENILTIDEDRLLCVDRNTTSVEGVAQPSIYAHWFVLTSDDVADFIIYIKDEKNNILYTKDIAYNLRSLTITIDNDLEKKFKSGGNFDVCIQARASSGAPKKWHPSQCQKVTDDFDSWPKNLTVDKRRLTKKKVKYSWFSNSVLGLVSDSILITLVHSIGTPMF